MNQNPVEKAVREFIYSKMFLSNEELREAAREAEVDPADFHEVFINSRVTVSFWEE